MNLLRKITHHEKKLDHEILHAKTKMELYSALQHAGLPEDRHLIVAIDFTGSNEWSGRSAYQRHLHDTTSIESTPYESTLRAIGDMMFDLNRSKRNIQLLGFGDIYSKTNDGRVTYSSISPNVNNLQMSLEEAIQEYRTRAQDLTQKNGFQSPTTFGPVIRFASQVAQTSQEYVLLVIITDGALEGTYLDINGQNVNAHDDTLRAVEEAGAANLPLSIIAVGVGDGESNHAIVDEKYHHHKHFAFLHEFEDKVKGKFDNFHMIKHHDYYHVNHHNHHERFKELEFAKHAFKAVPYHLRDMYSTNRLRRTDVPPGYQ